jgi:hypothetical protein
MSTFGCDLILSFFSTGNEANFRTAAYEAITSYLTHATVDAIPVVQNTVVTILQRMEQLLGMQVRHCTYYSTCLRLIYITEPNPRCR